MPDIAFNPSGLFATGERLPAIKAWLADTIWSPDRYLRLDPEEFLRTGETEVCRLEELVSTGAPQVWDELQADSQRAPTIKSWLGLDARLPTIHHPSSTIPDSPSTNPAAPPSIIHHPPSIIHHPPSIIHHPSSDAMDILGQTRFKDFAPEEQMPAWHPDLQLLPHSRCAMLRGRLRTRPSGPSSRKLYQHGGFSLMEVLVPWIELEPR